MALYSDKVMEHFMHPRNVGEIENPAGMGEVGNPVCGDMMTFMIKVENGRIVDLKFKTFGCGAAIAVSSMVSEMALGKTLEEALKITNAMVAEELGGLPKNKLHCSNLGADALHAAIKDYMKKHGIEQPDSTPGDEAPETHSTGKGENDPPQAEGGPETISVAGAEEHSAELSRFGTRAAEEGGAESKPLEQTGAEPSDINIDSAVGLHLCPYCDEPLEGSTPLLCNHCHVTFVKCPECGELVNENAASCPHCGADLKTN